MKIYVNKVNKQIEWILGSCAVLCDRRLLNVDFGKIKIKTKRL